MNRFLHQNLGVSALCWNPSTSHSRLNSRISVVQLETPPFELFLVLGTAYFFSCSRLLSGTKASLNTFSVTFFPLLQSRAPAHSFFSPLALVESVVGYWHYIIIATTPSIGVSGVFFDRMSTQWELRDKKRTI